MTAMDWKQAYDTGELENTALIIGRVDNLQALPVMEFYYTRKEAAEAAAAIGWGKKSARRIDLPMGRHRWAISDDHGNVITAAGYRRLVKEREAE